MTAAANSMSPYAYPDVTVVCGEPAFEDDEADVLLNPTVIVEVLSPTTEGWDRSGKFERYRDRASLQEYLQVAQDSAHLERYARLPGGEWLPSVVDGLDGALLLTSIGCWLELAQVYHMVTFPSSLTVRPKSLRSGVQSIPQERVRSFEDVRSR